MNKKIVNSCIEISQLLLTVGKEHEAYNNIVILSENLENEISRLLTNSPSEGTVVDINSVIFSIQKLTNALNHDDVSILYDVLRFELPNTIEKLRMDYHYDK